MRSYPKIASLLPFLWVLVMAGCNHPTQIRRSADLRVEPSTLDFSSSATQMTFNIVNRGNAEGSFSVPSGFPGWVQGLSPSQGTVAAGSRKTVTVTISRDGLEPGAKEASVTIATQPDGNLNLALLADVPARANLGIEPNALDFGSSTTAMTFDIVNDGNADGSFTVTSGVPGWVQGISPSQGTVAGGSRRTVTVTISRAGLTPGTKHADVNIAADSNGSLHLALTAVVPQPQETLLWSETWQNPGARWTFYDADSRNGYDTWEVQPGTNLPCGTRTLEATDDGQMDYDDNMDARAELLDAASIDISNYSNVSITFIMAYRTESSVDKVRFEVETDGTWYYKDEYTWSGDNWAWNPLVVRASEWTHWNPSRLRFRFRFITDGSVSNELGVLILCPKVYGTPRVYGGRSRPRPLSAEDNLASQGPEPSTLGRPEAPAVKPTFAPAGTVSKVTRGQYGMYGAIED